MIDVGHPAHVHLFKHITWSLQKKKNIVLFTARDKENAIDLLRAYNFWFVKTGPHYNSILKKIYGMLKYNLSLLKIAWKFKPDILLSAGSICAAHVSFLLNKPHISMEDTGNMEQIRLYKPFTKAILTPKSFPKDLGKKQIRYNGYHELAYLHPDYFKPNPDVLRELGIKKGEKFFILRFVAWKATHDIGHKGLSIESKRQLIEFLGKFGKVFISSEKKLPQRLVKYKLKISPEKIHDILYYATIYVGEGATMASECAILGTPAIYVNDIHLGYTDEEQDKYGLIFQSIDEKQIKRRIIKLLNTKNLKKEWQNKREKLLKDNIDVTKWMLDFVECHFG
ncbi:MAG: DUF354 domain-containing protein [Candidatus Hodarchaeota archaeon]